MHETDDAYSIWKHLVVLLAGPISDTSTQHIDFVESSTCHWICLLFILLILVGVELPLCIVVIPSWNAITCFWSQVKYKIVLFYLIRAIYPKMYVLLNFSHCVIKSYGHLCQILALFSMNTHQMVKSLDSSCKF